MALALGFVVLQTNSPKTMTVLDASIYPTTPPVVVSPTMNITPPGFPKVVLPFTPNDHNVYNSTNLGITLLGKETPLPDGIYTLRYFIVPEVDTFIEQSILRIDRLQEKYDNAIMSLDMMECDLSIKKQTLVQLDTIYLYIQGAIAAANNCAVIESNKLYKQADKLLDSFLKQDCGCSGNNY